VGLQENSPEPLSKCSSSPFSTWQSLCRFNYGQYELITLFFYLQELSPFHRPWVGRVSLSSTKMKSLWSDFKRSLRSLRVSALTAFQCGSWIPTAMISGLCLNESRKLKRTNLFWTASKAIKFAYIVVLMRNCSFIS